MADDQFEQREKDYNDNIGSVVGKFAVAIVEADSMAKDSHAARVINLSQKDNAEFKTETKLIGMEDSLETRMSIPLMSITDLRPVQVERAELEMDMTVSASNESTTDIQSKTGMEAGASAGWGPFSASVKITADVSVGKTDKRTSDYRSHTNAKLIMTQGDTPEGLALILDAMNQTVATRLEINKSLAQRKAGEISPKASSGEIAEETETATE